MHAATRVQLAQHCEPHDARIYGACHLTAPLSMIAFAWTWVEILKDSPISETEVSTLVALIALVLILALFGGLGFAAHVLWYVLIIAVILWLLGFFVGGVADGGKRRWYGRW
jgi:hypothetical protein